MALGEDLLSLASLAGATVVTAAVTDAWEAARTGFARLLGRGDPRRTELAERRLDQTREELAGVPAAELGQAQEQLAAVWRTRLLDLLDEHPETVTDLQALVERVREQLPAGAVSATGHGVAAGRDVTITASGGSVAAGTITGNVTPGKPYTSGSGIAAAVPGGAWAAGPGSVAADRGGVAVGRVAYQRPVVASQPVRLLPRPTFLAGREELLADLNARLSAGDGPFPRLVALSGLGGAGKTSVAVEYAYRHLATLSLAWQLPAEEPTALAAAFGELAALLGARDLLDPGNPVGQVHAVLAARPGDWLLIFDNAPGPAALREVLPPAGRGRVLITSQDPHWPGGQAAEVSMLSQDVAADFLVARTGSGDRDAARELAGDLGGLPLALEQASAYILATGRSMAEYLAMFRDRRADLLARGEPTGYDKRVATAWTLAFEQVEATAPSAAGLLRLLACYAPEPIPLRLLLRPLSQPPDLVPAELAPLVDDPLAADDALAALRRFSLVSAPRDGLVSVHRLVQAVTLDQLPADLVKTWRKAARTLLESALPDDRKKPETWPAYVALLPHAQITLPADSDGMAQIASFLGDSGNFAAARDLQQQITDARERLLGAEDPVTLTSRADLAYWTGEAGDRVAARDQFAALLPVDERVRGAEDLQTLIDRAHLAFWTGQAGNPAAARDQYAALLPLDERVLGAEHSQTLTVRANLAQWTGEAGDSTGARDQYMALLPVDERVFGTDNLSTLFDRGNLAYWAGQAGDPAGARDLYAALLPVVVQVLGAEHPETLTVRANLARWTGQAENPAGARDLYAALLPVDERVRGPRHPHTVIDRGNLAENTGEAGDPAGARDQYVALLPVAEQVLGAEHPYTLADRAQLARWTGEAGDPAEARDQFAALLPIYERTLGADHPFTLACRTSLARWTGEAEDPAEARDQFAALLPIYERTLGADHPFTLGCRGGLARWTGEAEDPAEARDQFAALLPIYERTLGAEHPETLTVRRMLARWTGHAGDAVAARDQFTALLPVVEQVLGAEHPETLTVRGNLAHWTGHAGDAVAARDQFTALLPIYEQVLGAEHPGMLAVRARLAHWTEKQAAKPTNRNRRQ